MQDKIQEYKATFTDAEMNQASLCLTKWQELDTWTFREGLLLMVGIDPHHSNDLVFHEAGFTSEWKPSWARITTPPSIAIDGDGVPTTAGFVLDIFQFELLGHLLNLWVSNTAHTVQDRHPPAYYRRWAESKGYDTFLSISGAAVPDAPVEELDYSLLATRDQLVAAFGPHTGMDASWFKKLDVGTQLMKARKVRGQGGRGHTTEPFFCPYLVMLFLIDPKRKKGNRKIKDTTGWHLLKRHFPKVHAIHAEFDPNAD